MKKNGSLFLYLAIDPFSDVSNALVLLYACHLWCMVMVACSFWNFLM